MTVDAKQPPIEKIRRVLALAGSSNEHEAQTAMAKAQELLAEWHLTADDVKGGDPTPGHGCTMATVAEGKNRPLHLKFIGGTVSTFFFVTCVANVVSHGAQRGVYVHIVGKPQDVTVAEHVYCYLRTTYKRLWLDYRKAHGLGPNERAKQTSYYQGITLGLGEKLAIARAEVEVRHGKQLVPFTGLEDAAKSLLGQDEIPEAKAIEQDRPDESVMLDGYDAGFAIELTPGVTAAAGPDAAGDRPGAPAEAEPDEDTVDETLTDLVDGGAPMEWHQRIICGGCDRVAPYPASQVQSGQVRCTGCGVVLTIASEGGSVEDLARVVVQQLKDASLATAEGSALDRLARAVGLEPRPVMGVPTCFVRCNGCQHVGEYPEPDVDAGRIVCGGCGGAIATVVDETAEDAAGVSGPVPPGASATGPQGEAGAAGVPEGWVRVTCRACGYAADYTEACMGAALPCGGCHAPIACYRAVADGRTAIGVPLGTQTSHSALLERMTMMDVTADGSHRAAAVRLGDSTYGAWVVMEHPMAGAPRRVLVKTTGSFELDAPADPDWHRLTRFPTPQEGMGCYRHWCEPAP